MNVESSLPASIGRIISIAVNDLVVAPLQEIVRGVTGGPPSPTLVVPKTAGSGHLGAVADRQPDDLLGRDVALDALFQPKRSAWRSFASG